METLAYRLLQISEFESLALSWIITAASAYGVVKSTNYEFKVGRSTFLLIMGVLWAVSGLTSLLALQVHEAIETETLALLLGGLYGVCIPMGLVAGIFAAARSRDAYGTSANWFYVLIPIINLALVFSGRQEKRPTGFLTIVRKVLAAVVGLSIIALAQGISRNLQQRAAGFERSVSDDKELAEKTLNLEVETKGLRDTLKGMASDVPVPISIDEVTVLARVEANEDVLRYVYETTVDRSSFDESWRQRRVNDWCKDDNFVALIGMGATVEGSYRTKSGEELSTVRVSTALCRAWEEELARTMNRYVALVKGPQQLDDATILEGATYANRVFTYVYTVRGEFSAPTEFFKDLHQKICRSDLFQQAYALGITVKYEYRRSDGTSVGEVSGNRSCSPKHAP